MVATAPTRDTDPVLDDPFEPAVEDPFVLPVEPVLPGADFDETGVAKPYRAAPPSDPVPYDPVVTGQPERYNAGVDSNTFPLSPLVIAVAVVLVAALVLVVVNVL